MQSAEKTGPGEFFCPGKERAISAKTSPTKPTLIFWSVWCWCDEKTCLLSQSDGSFGPLSIVDCYPTTLLLRFALLSFGTIHSLLTSCGLLLRSNQLRSRFIFPPAIISIRIFRLYCVLYACVFLDICRYCLWRCAGGFSIGRRARIGRQNSWSSTCCCSRGQEKR